MTSNYAGWRAEFDTSGTGNWQVTLPAEATFEDLEALAPVIDEVREFLAPTIDRVA
jgi:hypothetical protein